MNKNEKTYKQNLLISMSVCLICISFSLCLLVGSSFAWFKSENVYGGNTITTGKSKMTLTLKKLNDSAGLLLTAPDDEDIYTHQEIDRKGVYEISVIPKDGVSGYCIITICDDTDILVEKTIRVDKDNHPSFTIHTSKNLYIDISNINWGNLEFYDDLESDYYFGEYQLIYKCDIVEYSILPEEYKELTFINIDGIEYYFKEIIEEENVISRNYPCLNPSNVPGLYDTVSETFTPLVLFEDNQELTEEDEETNVVLGEEVKHFRFKDFDDISFNGNINEPVTLKYDEDVDDIYAQCNLEIEGFDFVGWKYDETVIKLTDSLNDILHIHNPDDGEIIELDAIFSMIKESDEE